MAYNFNTQPQYQQQQAANNNGQTIKKSRKRIRKYRR